MRPYVFDVLVILGVVVMTLGVVGLLRMPDVYTKLHGASKSVFLGVMVLALSGVVVGGLPITSRVILICLALLITTPVTSHVIGRAAYLRKERMATSGGRDESGMILPADDMPRWRD
jgi:multicomponent Na+:H+ antiporter subunit G